MTRSAYATTSALVVPCPTCFASVGDRCIRKVKIARFTFRDVPRKTVHSARRRAADDKRTAEVQGQAKPFFTPSAEPIPPEYYHNVPGRDGIFVIPSTDAPTYCNGCSRAHGHCICADPPSYLHIREPLPPRIPDLDPDEHGPRCPCDDCETERNR